MNSYNAKYKRGLFWKTVKGIVADGFVETTGVRFFVLEDGTRIEIPMSRCVVEFDKKRTQNIEQETQKTGELTDEQIFNANRGDPVGI